MELFILFLACCFIAYIIGYRVGVRHCFDILKGEMEKYREEQKNGDV